MTLEQAVIEARLKVVADFGYRGKPDLNNLVAANEHDRTMQKLFHKMEEAENEVRANWKEPKKMKEPA